MGSNWSSSCAPVHAAPGCPVLLLTCRPLDPSLLARLAQLGPILYAGKSIFTPDELAALVARTFSAPETLSSRTGDLVKQAIFYIQQHFDQPLNRSDVADAISVSENYLSQIFRQEMGISLWDYLNRQRIVHAQHLLDSTSYEHHRCGGCGGHLRPCLFQPDLSQADRPVSQRLSCGGATPAVSELTYYCPSIPVPSPRQSVEKPLCWGW